MYDGTLQGILRMRKNELKRILEARYREYNRSALREEDPVFFVHRYSKKEDAEIAGLIASSLAYGRIPSIKRSILNVLASVGSSPSGFLSSFHPGEWERSFGGFKHRFNDGEDIANLIFFMKQMIERSGSIENFFMEGYGAKEGLRQAIAAFSERSLRLERVRNGNRARRAKSSGVEFFFPSPEGGSTCKRMNLYLRWMIRKDNIDRGIWTALTPSELIIPVDTHIVQVARRLGFTRRTNPSWTMACEITEVLREFDPNDPVKYDFSLCHHQLGSNRKCSWKVHSLT